MLQHYTLVFSTWRPLHIVAYNVTHSPAHIHPRLPIPTGAGSSLCPPITKELLREK